MGAHLLGIASAVNEDLSIALGSSCVSLWDLTQVYALFDRMGQRVHPLIIRKVVDRDGRILEDHTAPEDSWAPLRDRLAGGYAKAISPPEQVIDGTTAFLMTHLMQEVVQMGTGAEASKLGKPAAGKTGTTNDSFDTWFMGFTHDLVTGVWLGYDSPIIPLGKYENGGRAALPIWLEYMEKALDGRTQPGFEPPISRWCSGPGSIATPASHSSPGKATVSTSPSGAAPAPGTRTSRMGRGL